MDTGRFPSLRDQWNCSDGKEAVNAKRHDPARSGDCDMILQVKHEGKRAREVLRVTPTWQSASARKSCDKSRKESEGTMSRPVMRLMVDRHHTVWGLRSDGDGAHAILVLMGMV